MDEGNSHSAKTKYEKGEKVGNWIIDSFIGSGCDSAVYKAHHETSSEEAAIKVVDIRELAKKEGKPLSKIRERVTREVKILHALDHPYIVKLYDFYEKDGILAIVMEFVSRGELLSYIGPKGGPENEVRNVFKQLLEAVQYCHDHNVIHRDLKLENLLVDKNYNLKVMDFGFANFSATKTMRMKTLCGTLMYLAPEIFLGKQYQGPPVDVWAMGVILYAMVTGRFPFADTPELPRDVVKGNFRIPSKLSKDLRKLLAGMLSLDPNKRATIKDIWESSWMQAK
mmetsp:Transcript_18110/g.51079  ORF Transcript_18110/g.51079 Transcript_18110/m.51079 type:complete len:282 (-) Transcript_18110:14-859(-)|eukprot:CAMPEP_0119123402 /NCGR_PEP_ID=MMETSP1310-20130426/3357_1 /TAXON_ID=464262 /ORGANISM="Genus nov. species nov., Strain RCC2339" /LENGTH=281 /DNA_ID=CAMNT_0007113203 /DNA_START=85 /DNA_END=930 /DNA_ORIENTATION=+